MGLWGVLRGLFFPEPQAGGRKNNALHQQDYQGG